MALVQPPPAAPSERRPAAAPPSPPTPDSTMGSVSSLITSRTAFPSRPGPEVTRVTPRHHRPAPGAGRYHPQDISHAPLLAVSATPGKRQPLVPSGQTQTHRHRTYLSDDFPGEDWEERHAPAPPSPGSDLEEVGGRQARGGSDGAPPRLVPESGKLERNIEKAIIRPTAFKPVVPKSRSNMHYLSPRPGDALSNSQGNLNLLAPCPSELAPSAGSSERRSSYSGSRNGLMSQSCSFSLSDSGRNSLSSLPTCNSGGGGGVAYSPGQSDVSGHPMSDPVKLTSMAPPPPPPPPISHGHTSSDSGRSSSSKSTGSLTGMGVRGGGGGGVGVPLSDCGSCGRSPSQAEAYEHMVRDLEEKLRERDLELHDLRDNLDENEVAICQVYEEKQKRCELEMEELRQSCASRMQQASQKAQRGQQLLQLQIFQLQQDKKKLQEDFGHVLQEREQLEERCTAYEREKTQLGPRLEETKWEVCQKSGEISLLKQQLKDLQAELAQRVGEVMTLRGQLREARAEREGAQAQLQEAQGSARTRQLELEVCENELQRRKSEAELLRQKLARLNEELVALKEAQQEAEEEEETRRAGAGSVGGASGEAWQQQSERLRAELASERQHQGEQVSAFEGERRSWEEEKEKVIRYQKQLQQNYVQMYRRNRQLEGALRDLSMELEARELDDDEGSGNEINFDDVTATEI
ncbi:leucine zipper putative tumor suppressor 2 homolog isoform X2 [Clupea harengus]|uniref:Leucine zipper putative tumor suppressor 2 homolog isoform X2 n=1 Tax=Clupea harengus TaxID=7950 RepID=A0A6P8F0M7_CLUHA|nr:leucine zipper putative tumor suppressor 2 homolog isoform X2 [Clupea harengus]